MKPAKTNCKHGEVLVVVEASLQCTSCHRTLRTWTIEPEHDAMLLWKGLQGKKPKKTTRYTD